MKNFILITLTVLATQFSFANDAKKEFTKELNESFSVGASPTLEVDSQFGDINIIQGNSGEIEVDVVITVSAKNQAKADKIFESIRVDMNKTARGVRAETSTGEREGVFDSWFFSWGDDGDNFAVDYTIKVPQNTNIEIVNQHGDVALKTDVAKANIELQFGDLTGVNISDKLILEIAHGSAELQNLADALVEVGFGDFVCTSVNDLIIESQHSDVTIQTAREIKSDSGFGDYTLGTVETIENEGSHSDIEIQYVGSLRAESSFTYYTIEEVENSFHIENEHGDTKIKELGNDFTDGFVESSFGDINMTTDNNLELDISGTFMSAKLPNSFDVKTKIIEDHDTDIKGTLRGGSGKMGKLKVQLEHGSLKIR